MDGGALGGDIDHDQRHRCAAKSANRGSLSAARQAADQSAKSGSASGFRQIAAPADNPALFVNVRLTLGIYDRLDVRRDRDCLVAVPERVEREPQYGLPRQLVAGFGLFHLSLDNVSLKRERGDHPRRDRVAFAADIGAQWRRQLRLNVDILSQRRSAHQEGKAKAKTCSHVMSLQELLSLPQD